MSTQKSKKLKLWLIILAGLITVIVIGKEVLKSDSTSPAVSEETALASTAEPNATGSIQPSAPVEVSDRASPLPIDASEELIIGNTPASDRVVVAPSIMNSTPLTEKGLDDVFIAFSAQKTIASEKEAKKDAKGSGKRTFGDVVDNGPAIAPPRFTSDRRMSAMGSPVPLGANQTSTFNPPMMNGGVPGFGMVAAPAPEPIKTKVIFCADGECDELTTQGTKKLNPNAKNGQVTKEPSPLPAVKK